MSCPHCGGLLEQPAHDEAIAEAMQHSSDVAAEVESNRIEAEQQTAQHALDASVQVARIEADAAVEIAQADADAAVAIAEADAAAVVDQAVIIETAQDNATEEATTSDDGNKVTEGEPVEDEPASEVTAVEVPPQLVEDGERSGSAAPRTVRVSRFRAHRMHGAHR